MDGGHAVPARRLNVRQFFRDEQRLREGQRLRELVQRGPEDRLFGLHEVRMERVGRERDPLICRREKRQQPERLQGRPGYSSRRSGICAALAGLAEIG